MVFTQISVSHMNDPGRKAQVKKTAPVQVFCSLTMLQQLPGLMQFLLGATLKMFKALTQCFCVQNANYMPHCVMTQRRNGN